jgi:hypothetical protein
MQTLALVMMAALLHGATSGCDAVASVATTVAVKGADFGGATADVHCDRRGVAHGGQASAFCQEVVATVAASQFSDDCRLKHEATPGPGLCSRAKIIAGCKLLEQHDDHSVAWDWYYDVSAELAEAGPNDGPDGGPTFNPPVAASVEEVARICADSSRYPGGAELVAP